MTTTVTTDLLALAAEAYGTGCATQDAYYAGVEALANYLAGGQPDAQLRTLLADVGFGDRVRSDPRRVG